MKINALVVFYLILTACTTSISTTKKSDLSLYPKASFGLLEITSFDIYKDGETLHTLISGLKTEKDTIQTVSYLQSTDNGKNWSIPVEIPMSLSEVLASRGNDVQIAAKGENLVAIWQAQGGIPNSGALMSVYSHDAGKTWLVGKIQP